jgi:hypothetical protein
MSIIASCGCRLESSEDLVDVRYGDYTCDAIDGFSRCVAFAVYCRACADELKGQPHFIATDEQEASWLNGAD